MSESWYINIEDVKTDYVKVENIKQWLVDVPLLHPSHPNYKVFWSKQTKKCIEGVWGSEWGKYRFMPGNMYYCINYTVLEHTLSDKSTVHMKPIPVDFMWDYAYMSLISRGFAGFSKDDVYSCADALKTYNEGGLDIKYLPKHCFNKEGDLKEYIDAWDYLYQLHDEPLGKPVYDDNPAKDAMVMGCHRKDTMVRMFNGDLKAVQDIKIGDTLMGVDSKPRTVLQLHRGKDAFFEVNQPHGDTYYVNSNHIMAVYKKGCHIRKASGVGNSPTKHVEFITANKVYEYQQKQKNNTYADYVGYSECSVEYPEKDLKLHPYFMGLWLGDGFKNCKKICVNEDDSEILDWLKSYSDSEERFSYSLINNGPGQLGTKNVWRFSLKDNTLKYKNNWWGKTFRNNKHISNDYLINSRKNRLELLAGMIDSDGSYESNRNRYTITNCDYKLIRQFQILAKSLGFKAVINKPSRSGVINSLKYNLRITGKITEIPVRLTRKKAIKDSDGFYGYSERITKRSRGSNYNTLKLTPLPEEEYYGFELDGDHLFLLEDYTVVHNSRGSMKSFWVALAELEYNFVFAGAKMYNIDFINQELTSSQCAGSSDTDKSSELLSKLEFSLNAKTDHSNKNFVKWFGIWGKQEEPDFAPCPFYRRTLGNFNCPNKKNPFRHQYKVEINGQWKTKGTNSKIFHVNYSTKKGDGAQAAVGGRYVFSVVEEVGLSADFISVKTANDSTTARAGLKFGVQWAMGTSGNIQYVQAAKKVFLNPQDYGIINFYNQFGAEGKERRIAYFIPYYMTILQFKDENGNTDYKSAIDYVNRQRRIYSGSKDPKVLREEMMNRPCKVEEMWLTDLGYYLPYEEATVRERELMTNNYYKTIGTPVDLHWDNTEAKGVAYRIAHNAEPHYNFPIPKDMKDPSGTPMIYEFPPDSFPNDMFSFVGYDNYVEENLNAGGSLGVTFILKNPKYITQGETGNIIVASYIGKPSKGLDYYHEQQEKLLALYGNPIQGLWFEKNRGDAVREYYIRKHKTYLLCHTPQRVTTSNIYQRTMQSYGFVIGNKISKIANLKLLHDWLLEETTFTVNGITETKLNIQRIPCIFLIRQIMQYTLDDNFDAVSAMLGCIIGLRENQNLEEDIRRSNSNKKNIFAGILNNKKIYRNARLTR